MTDPSPPDSVRALAQPSSTLGADAPIFCDRCGWEGTWRTCDWSDEGSFEEGYWRAPHCPDWCDLEVCDNTLFEVEQQAVQSDHIRDATEMVLPNA